MNSLIYIGVDDTDNSESRGTGFVARTLAQSLKESGLVNVNCISRHQLLLDPQIPYTSHNSSACIVGEIIGNEYRIQDTCSDFILEHAAVGSDAGLCIVLEENITDPMVDFGKRAKHEILTTTETRKLARKFHFFLAGLTGEKIGIIGALAAVGLRFEGNDGRLLWLERLREVQGIFSARKYKELVPVDQVVDLNGKLLHPEATVKITEWCRPVVRNKKIVLFAKKTEGNENYEYQSASKEYIKHISE
ncbi:MAG: hypothetical protein V1733_05270 [bacterium]